MGDKKKPNKEKEERMGIWQKLFGMKKTDTKATQSTNSPEPLTKEARLQRLGYRLEMGCRCVKCEARLNVWVDLQKAKPWQLKTLQDMAQAGGIVPKKREGIFTIDAVSGEEHLCLAMTPISAPQEGNPLTDQTLLAEYADIFCFATIESASAYFGDLVELAAKRPSPCEIELDLVSLRPTFWMVAEDKVHFGVVIPHPKGEPPQDTYAMWLVDICGEANERALGRSQRPLRTDMQYARIRNELIDQILDWKAFRI